MTEQAGTACPLSKEQSFALAEQYRAKGQLDAAEAVLNQVLQIEPDEANALHLLGILAHQRGRIREAIAHLTRACALSPKTPLFHANLGEMHRLAGQSDLALRYGQKALELNPNYPEACRCP